MTAITYSDIALDWSIEGRGNRRLNIILALAVTVMLALGITMSSLDLPEEKRQAKREVPPRIAEFLIEKKKAQPQVEPPKPEEVKPKPKPRPKPKPQVKKTQPQKTEQKPLTRVEKEAREKAAESGLLALSNELADLMDTDDISAMVGGTVKSSTPGVTSSNRNQALLLSDSDAGSGGVGNVQIATTVGKTTASEREISAVKQSLLEKPESGAQQAEDKSRARTAAVRSEESVTLVFDRNKGVLYSLYNRARRKNPGLKGKIILELTIAASGKVTSIRIVSSELGDATLESRISKRIKQFDFGAMNVEEVKVTYPIVFLPS